MSIRGLSASAYHWRCRLSRTAHTSAGIFLVGITLRAVEPPTAPPVPPVPATSSPLPALRVEKGRLLKDGVPCALIGVNYYDGFMRRLDSREGRAQAAPSTREAFALLRRYEVPFARFAAGGFFPSDWALYQENPDAYFTLLDEFVAEAERAEIGLVPSFFWVLPVFVWVGS
jgi:hypothetical protein